MEQGYDDVAFLCSIAHEHPSLQKHVVAGMLLKGGLPLTCRRLQVSCSRGCHSVQRIQLERERVCLCATSVNADSEFANVAMNDLELKKGHARQLLASLLGSTFDADLQKLVAKPISKDSAVSAWNSIIEADAPGDDDSSDEEDLHGDDRANGRSVVGEPDHSLSPIRSRPSPSPFKGVDSPLQSFLEPTEG